MSDLKVKIKEIIVIKKEKDSEYKIGKIAGCGKSAYLFESGEDVNLNDVFSFVPFVLVLNKNSVHRKNKFIIKDICNKTINLADKQTFFDVIDEIEYFNIGNRLENNELEM